MNLEPGSIPLAAVAAVVRVLSPCVWPLVPVVMSSATDDDGRAGPIGLASGLALSFAVAGTLASFVQVRSGLAPEPMRRGVALLLVVVAVVLVAAPPRLGEAVAAAGSRALVASWARPPACSACSC